MMIIVISIGALPVLAKAGGGSGIPMFATALLCATMFVGATAVAKRVVRVIS